MNLCLGTTQFGMNYGIVGQKKPSVECAINCLDYATQNDILTIDTATAYGTAEEVVGAFLAKKTIPREKLFICTKLRPNILDEVQEKELENTIRDNLEKSLLTLHTDYVDAYLLHSARYAHRPEILSALYKMQEKGLARKVGVSVYEPEEAEACFLDGRMGLVQLPYSIFDHRMKEKGILDSQKKHGCEIHARSAFIQGLITLSEEQVPSFLEKAKPIIRSINKICKDTGLSRVDLAMAYVKRESAVSHLVFGIDSLEQLKEDIQAFHNPVPEHLLQEMEQKFQGLDANLVMPSLWKK